MGCATMLSDADSIERRIFCLDRDRPTALKAVILALGILLTAAAIAATVTVVIEWMRTAYLQANTNPKAEFGSELARDSEGAHPAVSTTAPAATAFLLESPFTSVNALLFLLEPVGSESLRQGQASAFTPIERPSANLVIGALLPRSHSDEVSAPSDEHQIKFPLPRSRPFNHKDMRAKNDTAGSAGVATAPKIVADASPTAPSASFIFLKKLFHFWQARNDIKLPSEADGHTAVYDIEGHLVYLPNGEKLEAHSGLGKWLDDARYVTEKGRGPTPPNVYHLVLRKSLFHGVQAIRLNPVDGGKMYGREGMLAHPYMLGPDGQSNGCVSLQDYPKFLEAFLRGDIDRLIVVPHLEGTPSYAANAVARDRKQYALQ
jgi:type VI secretion system (T6SS) effector TldE1-like protein